MTGIVVHGVAVSGMTSRHLKILVEPTDPPNTGPLMRISGLSEFAERDVRIRVASSLSRRAYPYAGRVTLDLRPGERAVGVDLPIALAFLRAAGGGVDIPEEVVAFGDLLPSGEVLSVRGAFAAFAAARNFRGVPMCGRGNASEGWDGEPFLVMADVGGPVSWIDMPTPDPALAAPASDMRDLRADHPARRVLEVAAVGGHGVLLVGPPGSGHAMAVRRLAGILPTPTLDEIRDMTLAASISGILCGGGSGAVTRRPVRAPHHTASVTGLLGGVWPGEVGLAHRGVLFLDEANEFRRRTLERLDPAGRYLLVASVTEVAGQNLATDLARIAPLNRHLALRLDVPAQSVAEWMNEEHCENSATVRERVTRARAFRAERGGDTGGDRAVNQVARTLADMDGSPEPRPWHETEAMTLVNPACEADA